MSNYLEIDSKILEKNLLLSNSSEDADVFEKFLQSPENYSKENTPWKLATPTPGFCLKTADAKNEKVFINVCKLDDIPEPKDISEAELLELWQSEDISDYRIPLSIQDPHPEFDKSGKPTVAYDVGINTNFFKKIQENLMFRSFVIQVVLEGVENKYNLELKKEGFVLLQNRKCLGELRPHRIRISKTPYQPPKRLIEELPSTSTGRSSGAGDGKTVSENNIPEFRLYQNKIKKILVGEFHLPDIVTSRDLNLDVGEERIVLECRRGSYSLDVFVPVSVDENKATAIFNRSSRVLTVTVPIISASA